MDRPILYSAAALILAAIGLLRAETQFGAPGVIAFAKVIIGPAVAVFLFFVLRAGRFTGDVPRLRSVLIGLAVLTGIACAVSALFGVGWLVAK